MPRMRPYGKKGSQAEDKAEDFEIEEVNMEDGSIAHKAKGGFTFKGKGSKKKALEQARVMQSKSGN